MAKYMIHSCNARKWYVDKYLVPSMLAQGIRQSDILVWNDKNEIGNLESCMQSFLHAKCYYGCSDDGIWHLQDDVIICKDFKERTEQYNEGIVCGFCFYGDEYKHLIGEVVPKQMWYSFPCIRIPNNIAYECGRWFYKDVINNFQYQQWVRAKKYDDAVFKIYLIDYIGGTVLNLKPNLVDHIDYLIGYSVINRIRGNIETRSIYFEDSYLVDELQEKLKEENQKSS